MTQHKGAASGRALDPVEKAPPAHYDVDPATGCWNWNRSAPNRYGVTRYAGTYTGAHRAYFAHYVAPIPAGRVVMHQCDNTLCVNPSHLALGLQSTNQGDMSRKGRAASGSRHGSAKLNEQQALEIFRRAKAGEKQADLAAEFGVKVMQVSRIVNGVNWSHITRAA